MEGTPREQTWIDNVEALARAKALKGRISWGGYSYVCAVHSPKPQRESTANCERHRLIFELSCDKETIPAKLIPDAALVYNIFQEKLTGETNSQYSTIKAIPMVLESSF